jgi:ATP:corrinoid adenosyltransferase
VSEQRKRSIAGQTLVYFGDGKGKTTSLRRRATGGGPRLEGADEVHKMGEWPKGEQGEITSPSAPDPR